MSTEKHVMVPREHLEDLYTQALLDLVLHISTLCGLLFATLQQGWEGLSWDLWDTLPTILPERHANFHIFNQSDTLVA